MRYRPLGTEPLDERLGRFVPDDWEHVEKYPLTALPPVDRPTHAPIVIGVNWYSAFDKPEQDPTSGEFFIAKSGVPALTTIRGGHCVCLEPGDRADTDALYSFYNQGREGACVGFGWSRCMSLFNGGFYTARWLWEAAKLRDEWSGTNPGDDNGTSVRAAAEVLRDLGHVMWSQTRAADDWRRRAAYVPDATQGIQAFRWATSVDDVHAVLGNPRADQLGAVPVLNSWGTAYPHRVYMPDAVLAKLIEQDGEIAIPTDR